MQIVLTRDHVNVPWGFRLKGGAEYNVPLSILKVNEGTPAHYKLECGDVLQTIGNYPALSLKHEEALNLIRMFDLTLPLTIQRQTQPQFNYMQPSRIGTVGKPIAVTNAPPPSAVWRPPSSTTSSSFSHVDNPSMSPSMFSTVNPAAATSPRTPGSAFQQAQTFTYPAAPATSSYSMTLQNQQPQPQSYHQPLTVTPAQFQPQYQSLHISTGANPMSPSYGSSIASPPPSTSMSPAAPPAGPPPPPAPPMPASFNSVNNYHLQRAAAGNNPPAASTAPSSDHVKTGQAVPDALLKALNAPTGKKPFTYTPGGLDLTHIRQSARVKRYESMGSSDRPAHSVQHNQTSNFSNSYDSYHKQSTSQTNLSSHHYQNASFQHQQQQQQQQQQQYQQQQQRLNSASMNNFSNDNVISSSVAPTPRLQRQSSSGFNVTPEQLIRAKNREEPKDMANQSFSFRMLNKWISDSEANTIQLRSKKDEEEEQQQQSQQAALKKSEVIKALEEEEKRASYRGSQSPQAGVHHVSGAGGIGGIKSMIMNSSNYTVPSRAFQYVERKLSESESFVPRRSSQSDSQPHSVFDEHKPPARERDQEPSAPKYKGTNIPSKTFKYLQYITQNELVTNVSSKNAPTTSVATASSSSSASAASPSTADSTSRPTLKTAQTQIAPESFSLNSKRFNLIENNNFAHDSDAAGQPASLGVKSIMNRFNNNNSNISNLNNGRNFNQFNQSMFSTNFSNQPQAPLQPQQPPPMASLNSLNTASFESASVPRTPSTTPVPVAEPLFLNPDTHPIPIPEPAQPTPASSETLPEPTTPSQIEKDLNNTAASITAASISAAVVTMSNNSTEVDNKIDPESAINTASAAAAPDSLTLSSSIETTINLNDTKNINNNTTTNLQNEENKQQTTTTSQQSQSQSISQSVNVTTTNEQESHRTQTTITSSSNGEATLNEPSQELQQPPLTISETSVAQEIIETSEF